jgi:hypothetical protein
MTFPVQPIDDKNALNGHSSELGPDEFRRRWPKRFVRQRQRIIMSTVDRQISQ